VKDIRGVATKRTVVPQQAIFAQGIDDLHEISSHEWRTNHRARHISVGKALIRCDLTLSPERSYGSVGRV